MLHELLIFLYIVDYFRFRGFFRISANILKRSILCTDVRQHHNKNYVTDKFATIEKILLCSNIKFELTIQQKFNLMPSRTNNV